MNDDRQRGSGSATRTVQAVADGQPGAVAELSHLVYEELRELAGRFLGRERVEHTLSATALVHEAYLRLVDHTRVDWRGRTHFFRVGAAMMRRILVDHARARRTAKRGGDRRAVSLSGVPVGEDGVIDVLELHDALDRLATLNERHARVVELCFFGGLDIEETANALGVSAMTVKNDWRMARAWLMEELEG